MFLLKRFHKSLVLKQSRILKLNTADWVFQLVPKLLSILMRLWLIWSLTISHISKLMIEYVSLKLILTKKNLNWRTVDWSFTECKKTSQNWSSNYLNMEESLIWTIQPSSPETHPYNKWKKNIKILKLWSKLIFTEKTVQLTTNITHQLKTH